MKQLDPFISHLSSEDDKQAILRMFSNRHHKYHGSIKTKTKGDTELMAFLKEQRSEIERWVC